MYLVVDILVLLFVGWMLYRGIKKGFMGTTFMLVTALLSIVLAIGFAFLVIYFVFTPLGWMHELRMGLIGFADGLNLIWNLIGTTSYEGALYLAYAVAGIPLFIAFYIFFLWVERQFLRFCAWVRTKNKFFKIFGSVLGGVVNFAFAAVIVLGLFWAFAIVDGSGLFGFANESIRAAYLSGLIYENNPLYMIMEHGALAETIGNIINGSFLI